VILHCSQQFSEILLNEEENDNDDHRHSTRKDSLMLRIALFSLGVVIHICNLGTPEAEAGGSRVQIQPGLHSKTLYSICN
jgi:hypothetical protein